MKNCIVAVAGDLHVNGTTALCPPKVRLNDGSVHIANPIQRWIWNHWEYFWGEVKAAKEKYQYPVLVVLNGETADHLKYVKNELITVDENDMITMALDVLEPVQEIADGIIVTNGTEAHVGPGGRIDKMIGKHIDSLVDENGNHSRWIWREEIGGVRFHAAHHPGTSARRPWTKGNDANRLAAMMVYRYVKHELLPPHIAWFSHNHSPSDSFDNHPTRAIILPSWQLSNDFAHKINGDPLPIGAAYTVCHGKGLFDEPVKLYKEWPWPSWRATKKSHLHMTS